MGTTLTSTKIKDTYKSLVKISDNSEAGSTGKQLSDGNGNDLGLYVDTDGVFGIGGAATYSLDISSKNDGLRVPNGTTVQRPTGAAGLIRYNTTTSKLELYDSSFKNIASESYVNSEVTTAINNLVDSSPGTLDTLNELAAALNDDPDFHTTITGLINAKQDTITGAATTITGSDLTASRAVISNASGKVAVSAVTDTELGYLDGVTSAIQTQIDGKQDTLTAGTGIDITSDTISADLSGLVDTGAIQSDAVTAPKIAQFDDNLSAATAGDILISDGTDFTDVTVSGDITITSAGVTTIGNDKIDSQHYVDGSIDNAHLAADSVNGAKIADDSIDSEHYVDGSIDNAHLAADSVNGAKIADDSIDSEHYVDGSIDTAHIADDQVTAAKLEHDINLPGTGSVGIPAGTTAQRPGTPAAGMFRYNSTDGKFEGYTTEWGEIGGGGGAGTVTIQKDVYTGDGSDTTFDTTTTISSENNVQIYLDGVYQSKDNYTTSGSTVTFSTAPPNGASIELIHITSVSANIIKDTGTGDASTTAFSLSNTIDNENNTQVYIDGVYQSKDNYSVSGSTLTFSTAPGDGASIEFIHIKPVNESETLANYSVSVINSNTNAEKGYLYVLTGTCTLTLPASPTNGDSIKVSNRSGVATATVARNGEKIMGATSDLTIDKLNAGFELIYSGSAQGWVLIGVEGTAA